MITYFSSIYFLSNSCRI